MAGRRSIFAGGDEADPTSRKALQLFAGEKFAKPEMDKSSKEKLEKIFKALEDDDMTSLNELCRDKQIINLRNPEHDGNTALHVASENNNPMALKILLEAGAESEIQNDYGLTPLALADPSSPCCSILADLAPVRSRREALNPVSQVDDPFKGF